jgi:ABC-type glycerol-3-phosphate transport system substrate-binding protein
MDHCWRRLRNRRGKAGVAPFPWSLEVFLIVILATCLAAVGCQAFREVSTPPPKNLPPRNPDLPSERVTLNVWLDLDFWVNENLFHEIVQDFETTYPNVTVNVQAFVRESMASRVRQALQEGDPPDLAQGHVFAMAVQGFAQPLDDLWEMWGAAEGFLPAGLDEVTWEGRRYGVPVDIYCMLLLYNKDLFDAARRPYPDESYDAFRFQQDLAALTAANGSRYGLGLSVDPWYAFGWLAANGGEVLMQASDTYTVTLDTSNNIAALQFIADMTYNRRYGPLPTSRPRDYEDARKRFLAEKVAIFFGTPGDITYIRKNAPQLRLGVAPIPAPDNTAPHISVLGSTGFFIPRGARNRLVAFEFAKWATSDYYALSMARRMGRYPARNWLYEVPGFGGDELLKTFLDQLKTARPYRLDAFPGAERAFVNAVKSVFYGADAAQALHRAQQEAEATLRRVPHE